MPQSTIEASFSTKSAPLRLLDTPSYPKDINEAYFQAYEGKYVLIQ